MQWTPEELRSIWTFIRRHGPAVGQMSSALDMTKGQLDGIRRRHREEWERAVADYQRAHPAIDPASQSKTLQQNLRLQSQKRELEEQVRGMARETTVLEELRTMIEGAVVPVDPRDLPLRNETAAPLRATRETMVLNIGDLHGGEIVKPSRVKGLNEYNSLVCQQRFSHYIHSHLAIKEKLEAGGGWHFPELVVNLLGDIVSGTIHEIERHSDETIVRTCMGLAGMLAEGILHLAQHYPVLHVTGVVGNHGRLPDQRKKAYKDPERNWDYLIYLALAQYLRDVPNVKCFFPAAYSLQLDIRGWRFQIAHMDDVKSWGGLPAYGLDRYARNQNAGEAMRGGHIDYFVGGHFHQKIEMDVGGAEMIINGDMKGTDEWILGCLGKSGVPRQLFFAVHDDHGITHRWDVKLHEPDATLPQFSMTGWEGVEEDADGEPITVYRVG